MKPEILTDLSEFEAVWGGEYGRLVGGVVVRGKANV
jgi:hypothetical protein